MLKTLLKPNDSVADVGCHIGSFLSLAMRYAPNGRHIAFEASPTKAVLLKRKFRTAEIIAKAVSDHAGTVRFIEDAAHSGTSHVGEGGKLIEACTLDEVLTGRPVDLLKLDIEGHEFAALQGGLAFLKSRKPPIIFECGPVAITPHREAMFDLLASLGYGVMTFSDFLYKRGPMQYDEFRRCGIYPFRAMNYVAICGAQ